MSGGGGSTPERSPEEQELLRLELEEQQRLQAEETRRRDAAVRARRGRSSLIRTSERGIVQ